MMEHFDLDILLKEAAASRTQPSETIRKRVLASTYKGKMTTPRPILRPKMRAALISAIVLVFATTALAAGYALLFPDHETARYLVTAPDSRAPIESLDSAMELNEPRDAWYKVELLGEYAGGYNQYEEDYNQNIPTIRISDGHKAWNPDDYAFLRKLTPEVKEVYYDGTRLYINTFFETDHALDFLKGWGYDFGQPNNLDMTVFDVSVSVDGVALDHIGAWSSGTMMTVMDKTDEQIKALNGFWCSMQTDNLQSPLPDGICTVLLQYYIYDGDIDDMGSIGNIARILHKVEFDTRSGNRHESKTVSVPLSGDAIVTVLEDFTDIRNAIFPLDGITVHASIEYLPSGTLITLTAEGVEPTGNPLLNGVGEGLVPVLLVNGEPIEKAARVGGPLDEARFEFPLLPTDYDAIQSIALRLDIGYLTEITVGGTTYALTAGEQGIATDQFGESTSVYQTVADNIELPLP